VFALRLPALVLGERIDESAGPAHPRIANPLAA
jgi:hypothetical protein